MKKPIQLLIVLSLLLIASPVSAKLNDIDGHWAEESIQRAIENNIVHGFPEGNFRPNEFILYEEFAKMLASLLYKDEFEQVQGRHWSFPYTDYLIEEKLILANTEKRPGDIITRLEVANMIYNSLVAIGEQYTDTSLYELVKAEIRDWEDNLGFGVLEVYAKGVIVGFPDGNYRPYGALTRAEAVVILERLVDLDKRLARDIEIKYSNFYKHPTASGKDIIKIYSRPETVMRVNDFYQLLAETTLEYQFTSTGGVMVKNGESVVLLEWDARADSLNLIIKQNNNSPGIIGIAETLLKNWTKANLYINKLDKEQSLGIDLIAMSSKNEEGAKLYIVSVSPLPIR